MQELYSSKKMQKYFVTVFYGRFFSKVKLPQSFKCP